MASDTLTRDEQAVVDELTDLYGPSWDDSSDYSTRYVDTPRVERVRKHAKVGPHLPDTHWQSTSCLCTCHFGRPGDCDDTGCKTWRRQNAAKAQAQVERKRTRWERQQGLSA